MAVTKLKNLVLRGVCVETDVRTSLKRIGLNTANEQTPAMDLSHSRHPSHSYPQVDSDTVPWCCPAEPISVGSPTKRAGRLGSCPGVLASRNLAIVARLAVLSGWCLAERYQPSLARTLQRVGHFGRLAMRSGKRQQSMMARSGPFGGTLTASTRGTPNRPK
jgi:hypothetical protein